MIPVTRSYLPNKEKYKSYIDQIYDSGFLTNNGGLVVELERRLKDYLGVKNIILVANGSLALQVAYKALNLTGEVITTPFSFVATTSTLVWEGLQPVFADINPATFNIDVNKIECLINLNTSAILPVHVFGNPCEVEKIQEIADKNNLKVIYDAAHAFDVKYKDKSVLNYGDVSTLSFHATKIFHTIEGGAIITDNDDLAEKIRSLINFGIKNPLHINEVGINAKMNEFEAAMGLCVLDEIDQIQLRRKKNWKIYRENLLDKVTFQEWNEYSHNNYAYAPVLFKSEQELLLVENKLRENKIFPRRYFYPSLDQLPYLNDSRYCKYSNDIAKRILCLPLFVSENGMIFKNISKIIKDML